MCLVDKALGVLYETRLYPPTGVAASSVTFNGGEALDSFEVYQAVEADAIIMTFNLGGTPIRSVVSGTNTNPVRVRYTRDELGELLNGPIRAQIATAGTLTIVAQFLRPQVLGKVQGIADGIK